MVKPVSDLEKSLIDIDLTRQKYGEPIKSASRVIYRCSCQAICECTIAEIRNRIKNNKSILCAPCGRLLHNKSRILDISDSLLQRIDISDKPLNTSSRVTGICDNCKTKQKTTISEIKKKINKYGDYLCISCRQSSLLASPEARDGISKRVESLWSNPDYREKNVNSQIKRWDDQLRKDASEKTSLLWKDDNYAKKQSDGLKEKNSQPEHKKKVKEVRIRLRELNREKSLLWWSNPDNKQKHLKKIFAAFAERRDSGLERVVQKLLDTDNIEYERHFTLGNYEFDLFIPSHNLLIECQGEYWHSINKNKGRDAAKFTYINEYFPQYRILYLYEHEFSNPNIILNKINNTVTNRLNEVEQVKFEFSDLKIQSLDPKIKLEHSYYSAPEEFLQAYHYACYGRSAKQIYGAFLGEKLIAVCKFASVVRKEVATSMEMKTSQVLELDRFCIHPAYQKKNFASWMISRCSKLVFEEHSKVSCLVSFADSTHGHSGVIYKASNWTEIGKTKPSYHYANNDGFVIHKKTLWDKASKLRKTEAEYAAEHGYIKVKGKEKTKFILRRS